MADCSKTEVFLKEWGRFCTEEMDEGCIGCDFERICTNRPADYNEVRVLREDLERARIMLQKWSDAHPLPRTKTYADVFFEMHPKAPRHDGTPCCCRQNVFGTNGNEDCPLTDECFDCWNEPYTEQEN